MVSRTRALPLSSLHSRRMLCVYVLARVYIQIIKSNCTDAPNITEKTEKKTICDLVWLFGIGKKTTTLGWFGIKWKKIKLNSNQTDILNFGLYNFVNILFCINIGSYNYIVIVFKFEVSNLLYKYFVLYLVWF